MKTNRLAVIHRACTCTLVTISLCGQAHAQPEPDPGPPAASEDAPKRAPDSPSRRAEALFAEGVVLFKQWRFDEAEQKFREALTYREHPLIHLYLSRALEKQGHLVEAYQALQQALRPGGEPLPPEDVRVAEDLQQSLEARLAQIEVSCDVPGAEVSLDGEPWFVGPGRPRRIIGAGQHVIAARKPGYFPVAEPVTLIPGKQTHVVLRMAVGVVHIGRLWQPSLPWAVVGVGIATSLFGGALRSQASAAGVADPRAREQIGKGALIVGGSALAAGLAGVLLNLPRYRRSKRLDIVPMPSGDNVGISAQIQF